MTRATLLLVLAVLSVSIAVFPAKASPDLDYPVDGLSYGGKVRAGPGMDYPQTGSLREGDAVTIVNGTGVMMNGYEWFRVEFAGGQTGFQWGGLLCSYSQLPTIYRQCEDRTIVDTSAGAADAERIPRVVSYPGGSFVRELNQADWVERNASGVYFFEEYGVRNGLIVLLDQSRRVNIHLNLRSGEILYAQGGDPMRPIYSITSILY